MNTKTIKKMNGAKQITLVVSAQGMTVRVSPGSFRIGKTNYILVEEVTYTVKPNSEIQWIGLYLMQKKGGGQVVVAVDEVYGDEQPLDMSKDPEYDYLWMLASLKVPEGDESLENASLTIFASEPPPERDIGKRGRERHPLYQQPEKKVH